MKAVLELKEMPETCSCCPLRYFGVVKTNPDYDYRCAALQTGLDFNSIYKGRPENCPLKVIMEGTQNEGSNQQAVKE